MKRLFWISLAFLALLSLCEDLRADNFDDLLRCEVTTVPGWESALRYGKPVLVTDLPIDGRLRKVLYIEYDRRLLLFVFGWPELPGIRERGAWHGCGMYELAWWH
jgi:hypothetical protein